jgi:hypothetical protein
VSGKSQVEFATYHQRWQSLVHEIHDNGGTCSFTPAGDTTGDPITVTFDIEAMHLTEATYDGVMMRAWLQSFGFDFVCKPYGRLPAVTATLQDADRFNRDTITSSGTGEWAYDAGSGTLSVDPATERLTVTSTSEKRIYRPGITASDCSASLRINSGASVASGAAGVSIRRIDANNIIRGRVEFAGTSSLIRIAKLDAGVDSALATSATFTAAAATSYWLVLSGDGPVITLNLYTVDPHANPTASALRSLTFTLTGSDATKFGDETWGGAGIRVTPAGTDWTYDDWKLRASDIRSSSPLFDLEVPGVPGHVDALGELTLTERSSKNREFAEVGLKKGDFYRSDAPALIIAPPALGVNQFNSSAQLDPSGFAGTLGTQSGAYDPLGLASNTVIQATLSSASTATTICSTGNQGHVGPQRVKARVYTTGVGPTYVRLGWRDGDNLTEYNDWVKVPATSFWYELDLGLVTITEASEGAQRWIGYIEAMSSTSGAVVKVNYVEVIGADRYAKAKVAETFNSTSYSVASDTFDQTSGNLGPQAFDDANNNWVTRTLISSVSNALNPTVTTSTSHGLSTGDLIYIGGLAGAGAANVNGFRTVASAPTATTFTITMAAPGAITSSTGVVTKAGKGMGIGAGVSGPNNPSSFSSVDPYGGAVTWSNMSNASTPNDQYATANLNFTTDGSTEDLRCAGFNHNIPAGSTIVGIEMVVERAANKGGSLDDFDVFLTKSGSKVGTNHKHHFVSFWPTTDSTYTYGGPTDLWGTTWTVNEINTGLGTSFSGTMLGDTGNHLVTARVDNVKTTVYYSPPAGPQWYTWATRTGVSSGVEAAATGDFTIDTANHRVQRGVTDTGANDGRWAFATSTVLDGVSAQVDVGVSASDQTLTGAAGLLLRHVDSSNYVTVSISGKPYTLTVKKRVAGANTTLGTYQLQQSSGQTVSLRAQIDTLGRWFVWAGELLVLQGQDGDLAAGGALASGTAGLYDESTGGAPIPVRIYDNFALQQIVTTASSDNTVMFPGRSAKFASDRATRQNSDGSVWGSLPTFEGARLLVPPEGPGGLTSGLAVKAREVNVDQFADTVINDEVEVHLDLTPRVLLLG